MSETRVNIIVPEELKYQVKVKAAKEGKTITQVVVDFLKGWVKK